MINKYITYLEITVLCEFIFTGILIGTIFDVVILIYFNARPTINIEYKNVRNETSNLDILIFLRKIFC